MQNISHYRPTVAITNEFHEHFNIRFYVCILNVMFYVCSFIMYIMCTNPALAAILIKSVSVLVLEVLPNI